MCRVRPAHNLVCQILFVIKEPDVFKTNDSNPKGPQTFIVFGKAEIEDLSQQATNAAVEQFKPSAGGDVRNTHNPAALRLFVALVLSQEF